MTQADLSQTPAPDAPAPTPLAAAVAAVPTNTIQYDDFAKVQLRVGTIKQAEAVPKSKKLMRLQVDLGDESRQILAGIKEHYTPEALVGKQIVVVVNLAPREVIKGEVSNGMLLAASDVSGKLCVVSPSDVIASGATVR
ncbi:MAG: Methionyl-tRNA synthetase [Phycisphaerales bacterium]|nr:Methionyl-tRNA synthetase [Phycisphaerales bacterium]